MRLAVGERVLLAERVGEQDRPPRTRNLTPGPRLDEAVDELLARPYGNWHVETTGETVQLRVTKRGEAQVHRSGPPASTGPPAAHDRPARHLLPPDDPLFTLTGAPAAKRRQVDAFLRLLDPVAPEPSASGRPLRVVDLGCGNGTLTLAAHRLLARRGPVETVGVDVRSAVVEADAALAAQLGESGVRFVASPVAEYEPGERPDVVLALHACDTATDEALARAVQWGATVVLATPCCHHDLRAQLAGRGPETAAANLRPALRHGILRQRLLDTLTDGLRADLLRLRGYRVDAVELVDPDHTPRNTLLRGVRTGAPAPAGLAEEVATSCRALGVRPALAALLDLAGPAG